MTTEVAQVIFDTRTTIRTRLASLGNDERSWEKPRLKKMTKIEQCLYTSGFKDSVMKECVGLVYTNTNTKIDGGTWSYTMEVHETHGKHVSLNNRRVRTVATCLNGHTGGFSFIGQGTPKAYLNVSHRRGMS